MKSVFRKMQQIKTSEMARTLVFGSGARIFALGSQFVVLLILSRIMSKENFGDLMVVFAVYRLGSMALGTGLGNLVLYHVGRSGGDVGLDRRIHRSATLAGMMFAGVLTSLSILFAETIATVFGKPGLITWLVHMAPLMLFGTLNTVAVGSLDGRSRITTAIMISEVVPNAIRLGGLALIPTFDLPVYCAAHVLWISVALPWFWEARHLVSRDHPGLSAMSTWDARYAGFYALNVIAGQQLQGVDIIIAGMLFSSEQVAGYAIVSRIATLFPFFQQIMLRKSAADVGHLLQNREYLELNAKLSMLRRWSLISFGVVAGVIILASPFILKLFGSYSDQVILLIILTTPALVRSIFVGNDLILKMDGRAGISLLFVIASFFIVCAAPWLATDHFGVYALPLGMFISAVVLNPIIASIISRYSIQSVEYNEWLPLVASLCAILFSTLCFDAYYAVAISGASLMLLSLQAYARRD
ncbi:lipopolysaccharide biosynthesis protein [Pannonibacter sp. I15F10I1]|uniref:lipopolysaccharide biosynthesis protein n=1 Tax=Pannonibacter sp. I15F10I1 TaxID=2003580 RepID=UPI001644F481|nr:oligosaccharide flippase family protein [Pannonibacter sp. I15F10I1]